MKLCKTCLLLSGLLLHAGLSGCGDQEENDHGQEATPEEQKSTKEVTLYSLYPIKGLGPSKTAEAFHGYRVFGKVAFADDPSAGKEILAALLDGIDQSDGKSLDCFDPRHGIRTVEDGITVDYVVCFACNLISIYRDGTPESGFTKTTKGPRSVFNKHLKAANVILASEPRGKRLISDER